MTDFSCVSSIGMVSPFRSIIGNRTRSDSRTSGPKTTTDMSIPSDIDKKSKPQSWNGMSC